MVDVWESNFMLISVRHWILLKKQSVFDNRLALALWCPYHDSSPLLLSVGKVGSLHPLATANHALKHKRRNSMKIFLIFLPNRPYPKLGQHSTEPLVIGTKCCFPVPKMSAKCNDSSTAPVWAWERRLPSYVGVYQNLFPFETDKSAGDHVPPTGYPSIHPQSHLPFGYLSCESLKLREHKTMF